MKIATWNVNSLSVRLPQVLDWLAAHPVDILALQELKTPDDKFPYAALEKAGYYVAALGQKTYNGVALLARTPLQEVQRNIPDFADEQARLIAATIETPTGPLRIINGYFVNGQMPGSKKFSYKMRWLQALHGQLCKELAQYPQLILLGDFNIVPEDRDSYDPNGLRGSILHTDEERDYFQGLLALGLVDTFRLFEQPTQSFSWWDYRMLGFQKNRGLRIDHILASPILCPYIISCAIDRTPRKNPQPSDHTPVVLNIKIK